LRRLAAALLVGSFALAGCSSGVGSTAPSGDKSAGKALFIANCAACHTLAEAKATGKVGPDLDAAFGSDRQQGFKESTIRQVVADQIRFPGNYGSKGPTMPKNLVKGSAVDDVASYVAYVAGMKGKTVATGSAGGTTTTTGGGTSAATDAGKTAFAANGCNACHTLTAAGATGTIGPDLDKLKSYATTAGVPLEQFIHDSIVDPNKYVQPGYQKGVMPDTFASLPKSTIDALVAFLAASANG